MTNDDNYFHTRIHDEVNETSTIVITDNDNLLTSTINLVEFFAYFGDSSHST